MSRIEKVALKTIVCLMAAFVISFNMVAESTITAFAQEGENESLPAPEIVVTVDEDNFQASTTEVAAVPETPAQPETPPAQPETPPAAPAEPKPNKLDDYITSSEDFTYGPQNKKVVSILFYHDSDTDVSALKESDFDLNSIDREKYNVNFDEATGILTIAEKSNNSQAGSIEVKGNANSYVYYDFAETFNVYNETTGTKIYFVPHSYSKVLTTTDALLGVPAGTAILERNASYGSNSYATDEIKSITSDTGSKNNNVKVITKGNGFDYCPAGVLYYFEEDSIKDSSQYNNREGYTSYWCNGGGVTLSDGAYGHAYIFSEKLVNINATNLLVASKANEDMKTNAFTITDSDLGKYVDLKLTFTDDQNQERVINIAGCTVSDGRVNYRSGDTSIDLKVGNATVTLHLDTTGLEKKVWLEDNNTVIAKQIVTDDELEDIQKALSQGFANIEVNGEEEEYSELKEKLAASIWQKNNKAAITATEDDFDMYYTVVDTKKRYLEDVPESVKEHMSVSLVSKVVNMENKINELADDFIATSSKSADDSSIYTDATAENTDQILAAENTYNSLHSVIQDFVNKKFAESNEDILDAALSYGTILERAKQIKTVADIFVDTYASVLVNVGDAEKTKFDKTDISNYKQILNGANAWNNLTEEQRKYVNKALALATENQNEEAPVTVTFEKLLVDAMAIKNSLAHSSKDHYSPEQKAEEVVPPTFAPVAKKAVENSEVIAPLAAKESPVVTKAIATMQGKGEPTDDPKLRRENAHAVGQIVGLAESDEETEGKDAKAKKSILTVFEETADEVDAKVFGSAKQNFGLGAILINVETFLEDRENGTGVYMHSRGKEKSQLQAYENQMSYTLENADTLASSVLTLSELGYVNDGDTMEIRLRITPNENKISEEANEQFEQAIEKEKENIAGLTKGDYIDISLEKRHNSDEWQYVPNTKDAIRIAIDVPDSYRESGRQFYIMRNHDGECTLLEDLDDSEDTITIETDRFSDYLIMYDDTYAQGSIDATTEVLENSAVAALTVTPADNLGASVVLLSILFLLLIFAVVVEATRRESRR